MFIAYGAFSFKGSLNPYVTFKEAASLKRSVQIHGTLVDSSVVTDPNVPGIAFRMRDDTGEEASVFYKGLMPDRMEQAEGIVVIGKMLNGRLQAEKILVKCPSKYQGGTVVK